MNKTIQIAVNCNKCKNYKHVVLQLVQPKDMKLEIDEDGNCIIDENMLKTKAKEPFDLFEEEITFILNVEQEIKLYRSWGMALSIMIGRTADFIGIDRKVAKQIIMLAQEYGLLYEGNNYSWKIVKSFKSKWLDKAKEKEQYLKGDNIVNYQSTTPQEAEEKLSKNSTTKQKAIARGEASIEENNEESNEESNEVVEESPVEVLDDSKIYSGAAQAKKKEKEAREKQIKRESEKYKREVNSVNMKSVEQTLPKCITKLENYPQKGQKTPKK